MSQTHKRIDKMELEFHFLTRLISGTLNYFFLFLFFCCYFNVFEMIMRHFLHYCNMKLRSFSAVGPISQTAVLSFILVTLWNTIDTPYLFSIPDVDQKFCYSSVFVIICILLLGSKSFVHFWVCSVTFLLIFQNRLSHFQVDPTNIFFMFMSMFMRLELPCMLPVYKLGGDISKDLL